MEGATAAYYLNLEATGSLLGGGIWRPIHVELKKIRTQSWAIRDGRGELGSSRKQSAC